MENQAVAALPDDLLAVVLGCVPARSLAASRGVCKAWRDLIDGRKLLLRFLLPHSVRGLFINHHDHNRSHFLSRPTSTSSPEYDSPRRINGKFDFVEREDPYGWYQVADQCNGLVLLVDRHGEVLHVCNPTTQWSARLPPCPATVRYNAWFCGRRAFLIFDPFVSPEYKVLLSPTEPGKEEMMNNDACRLMEWPPLVWTAWHVFSSSTGRWEEMVFIREGGAAGTAGDLLLHEWGFRVEARCRYAAYWMGALYIHWRGEFISRLSLLDDKYKVIKSPLQPAAGKNHGVKSFLGRSEKGVYVAAIDEDGFPKLRVWTLSESSDHMEWVPKHQANLKINTLQWLENDNFDEAKYWTMDLEPKYWMRNQDVSVEQNVCWDSDDDNIADEGGEEEVQVRVKFLGFHPYKEVIFLSGDDLNAVAFHLNSPKVQYLGEVHLAGEYNHGIRESFVYTPCLIGN